MKKLILLFLFLFTVSASAQETIVDYKDSLPVLNEQLRQYYERIRSLEAANVEPSYTSLGSYIESIKSDGSGKEYKYQIIDDDDMSDASATTLSTSESVKAYVLANQTTAGILYTAGTSYLIKQSTTTSPDVSTTTYTKVKEIAIPLGGTITVDFIVCREYNNTGYGKIYINGIARGTERSTPGGASGEICYTAPDENFSVNPGDLVQLYLKSNMTDTTNSARAKSFRIMSGTPDVATITLE